MISLTKSGKIDFTTTDIFGRNWGVRYWIVRNSNKNEIKNYFESLGIKAKKSPVFKVSTDHYNVQITDQTIGFYPITVKTYGNKSIVKQYFFFN